MSEPNKNNNDFFNEYGQQIRDYFDDRILLLRLNMVKKVSKLTAQLAGFALVAMLSGMIILFISIMLGFFLGDLFSNYYAGFGLLTLIFIVLLFLSLKYRKRLMAKFVGSIIDIILDKKADEDD